MRLYLYSLLLFFSFFQPTIAQTIVSSISGPKDVCINTEYTYTYHGTCGNCFQLTHGYFVHNNNYRSCSLEGGPFTFKVVWTVPGSQYISLSKCGSPEIIEFPVIVIDVPVSISAVPASGTIGIGQSILLTATGGYSSYSWSCNNPGNCHIVNPLAQFTNCSPVSNTTYKVAVSKYVSTSMTCVNSATFDVTVSLNPILGNQVSGSQYVCPGSAASQLIQHSGATLSGGSGTYSYQWQRSLNDGVSWSNIAGATVASYSPGVITAKALFRRIVYSGSIQDVSNVLTVEPVPNNLTVNSQTFSENMLLRANDYINVSGSLSTTPGVLVQVKSGKAIIFTNTTVIQNTFLYTIESCSGSMRHTNEELLESEWMENTETGLGISPFPNPVSSGRLNFGQKVSNYALYDNQGSIVREGRDKDGVLVDNIAKGLYLLKIDNQIVKIFVE